MSNVNDMLEEAINESSNIEVGEIFLLRDLFKGYRWNRVPHRDRLILGILFLNYVTSKVENLQAIEKTSSNQQRYKKLSDSDNPARNGAEKHTNWST